MATEFTVILEDRPGTLARLGIVLGGAAVNIEAIHGINREESGIVQFVPNDRAKAARALARPASPIARVRCSSSGSWTSRARWVTWHS
jgi:hypothetical protein